MLEPVSGRVPAVIIAAEHGNGKRITLERREGHIIGSPAVAVVRRAGTGVPSDWQVVLGYWYAIPVWSALVADAGT
jgi:hypothetical protein